MITFLRKLPIKTQLSIIVIINIVVMLYIIIFSYYKVSDIYRQRNDEYTKELFTQIRQTVSYNCDNLNNIVTSIAYNQVVQEYLMETNPTKKFELYGKVGNFLGNMMNIKEGIIDMVILGDNGSTYDLNGGTQLASEMAGSIPERTNAYYFGIRKFENSNIRVNCFVIGTSIYSINTEKNSNMKIGNLMIFVDTNTVVGKKENTARRIKDKIYLLDRDNNVFSSNGDDDNTVKIDELTNLSNAEDTFVSKVDGEASIIHIEYLPDISGKIISIIPKNKLLYDITWLRNLQLTIFLIGMGILFIPFSIVVNNILQPLEKLMAFMNRIKSGQLSNLKDRINLQGYSEMSILAQEFNSTLDEIDSLTKRLVDTNTRLYEAELEEKQSELGYLRSQINPHFLYNTLESIKGIAVEEGNARIFEIAKALGQVFRYSIKGKDSVLLSEELMIVKAYVNIQQIRFTDRFEVAYEFEEELMEYKVPKMTLQPVVENAICHGLEMKMEKGHLNIGGKIINENELLIWVRDDGIGMDAETLERARESLTKAGIKSRYAAASNQGIGFINVNNRIKLTYGSSYGITINSKEGIGTEVLIKVPIEGGIHV